MNNLAVELNKKIEGTTLYYLLSDFGKRLYFPNDTKMQSAEAKKLAKKYNATEGMAFKEHKPMHIPSITKYFSHLDLEESITYSGSAGEAELRDLWEVDLIRKNPSLKEIKFSKPIVVAGLTHGLSVIGDLFIDNATTLFLPSVYWPNYDLLFGEKCRAELKTYNLYTEGHLDIESLVKAVRAESKERKIAVILNFPQNPTGYSPLKSEAKELKHEFLKLAEEGYKILTIHDDAYYGLFYEEDIYSESLFSIFSNLHENILALKVDGPTKEHFVWGFRIGFISIGSKELTHEQYQVIETKIMAAIRCSISTASKPAQSIIIKALKEKTFEAERKKEADEIKERYEIVKKTIEKYKFTGSITPAPFNSGYFMCFELKEKSAEDIRKHLLNNYGIGVISFKDKYLRVAYSCIDKINIEDLITTIIKATEEIR